MSRSGLLRTAFGIAVAATMSACAARGGCGYTRVGIEPRDPGVFDVYAGGGHEVDVEFRNDARDRDVQAFPEPPLVIRLRGTGRACEIVEGGVWSRGHVYLGAKDRLLAVLETSGSNDWLAFYDTADCDKRAEFDVSGAAWRLDGGGLVVGSDCRGSALSDCAAVRTIALDASCLPVDAPTRDDR